MPTGKTRKLHKTTKDQTLSRFQCSKEVQIKLASLILNEARCDWCKERLYSYLTNRRIRDLYVRWWCVTNEGRFSAGLRCSTNDEGRSLEAGIQVQASNHLVQLCLKGEVVSDKEKVLLRHQVHVKETNVNELLRKCR